MTTINEQPQTPQNIDTTTAHDAYQALLAAWKQRPSDEVQRPRSSIFEAVELGLKLSQQVLEDREAFLTHLAQFDPMYIDDFRAASLGLWAAETRWRTSRRRANQDEIDATVAAAQETRRELLAAADYIWRSDEGVKKVLRDIRDGAGQRDLADDLQRLADLFLTRWTQASGRSEITKHDAEQAAKLAIALLDEILQDEQAEALDIRNRAWSHWYEAYQELYTGGRYIHRRNPDAISLYPSLAVITNRTRNTNNASDTTDETTDDTTLETPETPSGADSNTEPAPPPTM